VEVEGVVVYDPLLMKYIILADKPVFLESILEQYEHRKVRIRVEAI